MPQSARLHDFDSGHGCHPPRPNASASGNVFVNSRGFHRITDSWESHCCSTCHGANTSSGSNSVFVNGLAAARIGDSVSCGSFIMTGSTNVFTGG